MVHREDQFPIAFISKQIVLAQTRRRLSTFMGVFFYSITIYRFDILYVFFTRWNLNLLDLLKFYPCPQVVSYSRFRVAKGPAAVVDEAGAARDDRGALHKGECCCFAAEERMERRRITLVREPGRETRTILHRGD